MKLSLVILISFIAMFTGQSPLAAEIDLSVAPVARSHTEVIGSSSARFSIDAEGRTPPVNQNVILIGPAQDVVIKLDGGLDFSSLNALAASIVRKKMTDEEKAKACFYYAVNNFYDRGSSGCDDPFEYLSLWGFSYCGEFALTLNALWHAVGLRTVFLNPVTLGLPSGHVISAVYYDNQWHMFDSRLRGYFLNWDNKTIASRMELDRDDELIRRAIDFSGGMNNCHWQFTTMFLQFFNTQSDWMDGFNAHFDNLTLFNGNCPRWDSRLNLRKGEKLTLNWANEGKWWSRKDLSPRWKELHPSEGLESRTVPPIIYANGVLEFEVYPPDYREQASDFSGIRTRVGESSAFQPSSAGKKGFVIYEVKVPYFIPSMHLEATAFRNNSGDDISIEISTDEGKSWKSLWRAKQYGELQIDLSTELTQAVTMYSPNKYSYLLRMNLKAAQTSRDVSLGDIRIVTDLYYRPVILPELRNGTNRLTYSDKSKGSHKRKLTFSWLEDTNILLSDDQPTVGDEVIITALVTNKGDDPVSEVPVRFYDGDPRNGGVKIGEDQVIPLIKAGEKGEARVTWRATQRHLNSSKGFSTALQKEQKGYTHNTLFVEVDPEQTVAEDNESNNLTSRDVIVYNMANLILYHPSFISFDRRGDKVRISAMVRNQNLYGLLPRAREARNVSVRFFDGQPVRPRGFRGYKMDNLIGEVQIPSIAPGEFGNAGVDWDVSGLKGRHLVYVVVDMEDEIPEIWQNGQSTWMPIKKEIVF